MKNLRPAMILYVDDEQSNLVVFEAACGAEFPVLTASSADEALELMHRHEVAVLLTDQRMPGRSGVELAEAVRAEHPDTIRMLVTAYADLDATIDAINRGHVRRYLRKPWDPRELRATLADALELYLLTRQVRSVERRLVETERVYALGVVAASVGHELRGPVSWVRSNLDLVRGGVRMALRDLEAGAVRREALVKLLRELDDELSDALLGTEQVVEIVRAIGLPTQGAETREVDLAHVVRLTLTMVRGELRQRAIARVDLGAVPKVRGSTTKLGQVVLNLVVNAVQALPERPPGLNFVDVRLRHTDTEVLLEVVDNGQGIAPDALERLFDPFYTTKVEGGTGLGLAISRRIVEDLGGRIDVESREGHGTLFRVTLPAAG
jgi:signal transduction histidine kinase